MAEERSKRWESEVKVVREGRRATSKRKEGDDPLGRFPSRRGSSIVEENQEGGRGCGGSHFVSDRSWK